MHPHPSDIFFDIKRRWRISNCEREKVREIDRVRRRKCEREKKKRERERERVQR